MYYEKPVITSDVLTEEQCAAFRRMPGSFNAMVREIFSAGIEYQKEQPLREDIDFSLHHLLSAVRSGDFESAQELATSLEKVLAHPKKQTVKKTAHFPQVIPDEASKSPF